MVIWVQNVRFIAKIGPKLNGKRQKNTNTKKTQVPDFFYLFFSESSISSKLLSYTNIKNKFFKHFFSKKNEKSS